MKVIQKLTILILFPFAVLAQSSGIWRGLPADPRLDVIIVDDFEERVAWTIRHKKAVEDRLRFAKRFPGEDDLLLQNKNGDLFQEDFQYADKMAALHSRPALKKQEYSLEFVSFFSHPGKDFTFAQAPKEVHGYKSGRPVAFSLWVYGNEKPHALYAVFTNERGVEFPIRVCDMNFLGWQRIEIPFPGYFRKEIKKRSGQYSFRLKGLKVVSHRSEAPGSYSLLVDFIAILTEVNPHEYPGSQIIDEWD